VQIPTSEKIKFFLWTALHMALPTKEMLSHRGMLQDNSCPRCNNNIETTLHCIRDCDVVKNVWKSVGYTINIFYQGVDVYVWLRSGLDNPPTFLFMEATWLIWCTRNKLRMNNEIVSQFSLRSQIENFAHLLRACFFNQQMVSTTKLVKWSALGSTNIILNVDWSSISNNESLSIIARPPHGINLLILADESGTWFYI
jgi:hypothetical protein